MSASASARNRIYLVVALEKSHENMIIIDDENEKWENIQLNAFLCTRSALQFGTTNCLTHRSIDIAK